MSECDRRKIGTPRQSRLVLGLLTAAMFLLQASPAAAAPASQPDDADAWLSRIEQRADRIDTVEARIRYDRIKGLLGSRVRRFGTLKYKAGPPAKFAIHFDRILEGRRADPIDRTYIFDGRWLAEKRNDEKLFIRRELVPAGEEDKRLLDMENQPFVLPLDQDKAYVLERFHVKVVPLADPPDRLKNTLHLRLSPKPDKNINLNRVDLWYDRDSLLPRRAVTRKDGAKDAPDKSVIDLLTISEDVDIVEGAFNTTPPSGPEWKVEIKPLKKQDIPATTNTPGDKEQ